MYAGERDDEGLRRRLKVRRWSLAGSVALALLSLATALLGQGWFWAIAIGWGLVALLHAFLLRREKAASDLGH